MHVMSLPFAGLHKESIEKIVAVFLNPQHGKMIKTIGEIIL